MKSNNYVVIQGWMCNELELNGNDLLVFALIYGFSQDGESEFEGSRSYIAETFNISKPTVDKALNNLISKGLIEKRTYSDSIHANKYRVDLEVVKNLYGGSKENLLGGSKESLLNNTNNINIEDNNSIIINNNTEFLGKIKSTKKKSLYDKCYDHILEFTNNVGLIDALTEYLQMRLQMREKPLYENSWKGMLNKLAKMDNQLEVVNTSIERGWASFYEQKSQYKKGKEVFGEDDNIKSEKGEFESSGETF